MHIPTEFSPSQVKEAEALAALLDAATTLCLMASKLEGASHQSAKDFVVLRKVDLMNIAKSQRLAASLIDLLALAVERGDTLAQAMKKR